MSTIDKNNRGYSSNDITPDQESHSDPFHYGRKKYTADELEDLKKQRAKDSRKYGVGSVVGAGASTGQGQGKVKYTIVKPKFSKKPNKSARQRPDKPEYNRFVK